MNCIETASKVLSTPVDIHKAIAQRQRRIVISPDFIGWDDKGPNYYSFQRSRQRDVFTSARVNHPGHRLLDNFNDLFNAVRGGAEVEIELNPHKQSAVRFCELLLATLYCVEEARKKSHDPTVEYLLLSTDWSIPDGVGFVSLPVPCVIGYTGAGNLTHLGIPSAAVIWSSCWQLSPRPVDLFLKRMNRVLRTAAVTAQKEGQKKPIDDADLAQWWSHIAWQIDDLVAELPDATFAEINHALQQKLSEFLKDFPQVSAGFINNALITLKQQMLHTGDYLNYTRALRHPAHAMFDQASKYFKPESTVISDYLGYPVSFGLRFGLGAVNVRAVGQPIADHQSEIVEPVKDVDGVSSNARVKSTSRKKAGALSMVKEAEFTATEGFRQIFWRNSTYKLSGNAATVVAAIYNYAKEYGFFQMHTDDIRRELYGDEPKKWPKNKFRVRSYFRHRDATRLWEDGFITPKDKGFYQLTPKIHR